MERPLTANIDPKRGPLDLAGYEAAGGYRALRKALGMAPKDVQDLVKHSHLRGRGGAGFPVAQKWALVPMGPDAPRPKYFIVNADEMEPGTFKDRLLMEGDPHQLIEGALISAYAIEASVAYIFLRLEYVLSARLLSDAIAQARAAGYIGQNIMGSGFSCEVLLHTSAGRYMCGEETGMINALEGKRANPRAKPPHPPVSGLWGKPTVVNNVETVCNIPHIVEKGPQWFLGLALHGAGTKIYGASGKVNRPGLWELPMGTSLGEILHEYAGGMRGGYKFKGCLPGGASTDFLVSDHLGLPMDFDSVLRAGSRLGTGTIVVLDDRTCPVGMVGSLMSFFARESCGWCTPCREGLPWAHKVLDSMEQGHGQSGDVELLAELCGWIGPGRTFCALAPGAAEPLQSAIKYFRDDFQAHIEHKHCPYKDKKEALGIRH